MNQVGSDCQDNLVEILKTAIRYGIYHIETARGYGSSELQLGVALKQLFQTGFVKRQDLIIQTKISANDDPVTFRENIELSLKNLQLDYIDLFAFHGLNYEEQMDWIFGKNGNNCLSVIQEYMVAGTVRHLGFSTHAPTELVIQCIQKDVFDYVNLHYHYFGSYTASGGGRDGNGNLECIRLLQEKRMGIFIISPFDKGGRLYAPSKKLVSLTLPEMDPMRFQSYWLWNHHLIYNESLPQIHTFTVGCGRPSGKFWWHRAMFLKDALA
jgi:predicted aldo/keto reductase-like oxidoreductase